MDTEQQEHSSNNHHHVHSNEWTLQELLVVLRRGRWTILLSTLIVLALVGMYTYLSAPVYEATGSVLIDNKSKAGVFPVIDLSGSGVNSKITNELETLRSRSLAEAVAHTLIAKKFIDETKQRPIQIIRNPDENAGNAPAPSIPEIVKRLGKAVDFTPVKESDIIKLTVRSNDPDEATLIANTYMQTYADRDLNNSRMKSRVAREFLQSQLGTKHQQLDNAERTLQSYMTNSGVVSLDAETERVVKQLSQLEATRDGLDVEIASAQKTLSSLKVGACRSGAECCEGDGRIQRCIHQITSEPGRAP